VFGFTTVEWSDLKWTLSQAIFLEGAVTIGEVAKQAGMAASAIRFYEKAGLLGPVDRQSGQRRYQPGILNQLVVIRFAKETGFTLPEIRLLLRGFPEKTPASTRWKKMARRKIEELEEIIAKSRAMKATLESVMSCRCTKLAQCAQGFAGHPERWRLTRDRVSRFKEGNATRAISCKDESCR
jgi:MerR family transcriptional regulator, redox-sensitive transcriptional activator SoxR